MIGYSNERFFHFVSCIITLLQQTIFYYSKRTLHFIQNKLNSRVIGSIGVHDINLRTMSCEISYGVSPIYWGKGIFVDTLNILLKDLFIRKNFNRVQAITSI